jgi:hypothetical protein
VTCNKIFLLDHVLRHSAGLEKLLLGLLVFPVDPEDPFPWAPDQRRTFEDGSEEAMRDEPWKDTEEEKENLLAVSQRMSLLKKVNFFHHQI